MRKSKYASNVRTVFNQKTFDSALECRRYRYLKGFESKGLIFNLETQVKYALAMKDSERKFYSSDDQFENMVFMWKNKHYFADFVYIYKDRVVIEDTKSSYTSKNKTFRLKKFRMRQLGYYVQEVLPDYVPFLEVPEAIKHKYSVRAAQYKEVAIID